MHNQSIVFQEGKKFRKFKKCFSIWGEDKIALFHQARVQKCIILLNYAILKQQEIKYNSPAV